jgi:hypothetical protein
MNRLMLIPSFLLLVSGVVLADGNPDHIELIQAPREVSTGLPFAYVTYNGSNYNPGDGICKALGFNNAIPGSDVNDTSQSYPSLQMNADGSLASVVTTISVAQIICQNRLGPPIDHQVATIPNPEYPASTLPFAYVTQNGSTYNSGDGICKILGHQSALPGSDVTDTSQSVPSRQVNPDGTIASEVTTVAVGQITCVDDGMSPYNHHE